MPDAFEAPDATEVPAAPAPAEDTSADGSATGSRHVPQPGDAVPQEAVAARRSVFVVFLCFGAVYANWVPRVPQIKHALGLSDSGLGVALLGAPVGTVCAVRLASWAVGRWGSRRVTRCGAVVLSAVLPLVAVAWNAVTLTTALLLLGAALGLTDVAMNAQGVAVERALRRPVMSGLHGAYSLGGLLGALLGSTAAHLDVAPLTHFTVIAVVSAATVWCGSRRLLPADEPSPASPGTPPTAAVAKANAKARADTKANAKARPARWPLAVLLLGLIGLCSFTGEGAVEDWSAVYLRDGLHAAAGTAGLGFAGCSAAMTVVRLAGDRLVARFGPVAVLRTGALVAASGLGAGLALPSLIASTGAAQPAAIAGFTLFGAGVALVAPVTFSAAGNLPGTPSASAISRVTGIGYLGFLAGPPVIGFTAQAAGLRGALAIPAALAAAIALLAATVRPRRGTSARAPEA
ncbi:MFS transporter [Streptomyces sp. PTM05]|uniref:MFS transporter n=1 Tax=Streptantibioticus parmotrematis TaxID=2873249 RepID=A0ABS7QW77_9ACTN|nr:MFS transporter [Streptantibioticus parmotrematis]MBY8886605.1 MFS transporter [Streptantibioticus parmotrematis]